MADIVEKCEYEQLFLSPTACHGILRRAEERDVNMNSRLKEIMTSISTSVSLDEIERRSRIQPRGIYSLKMENDTVSKSQVNLYDVKKRKKQSQSNQFDETINMTENSPKGNDGSVLDKDAAKTKTKQATLF